MITINQKASSAMAEDRPAPCLATASAPPSRPTAGAPCPTNSSDCSTICNCSTKRYVTAKFSPNRSFKPTVKLYREELSIEAIWSDTADFGEKTDFGWMIFDGEGEMVGVSVRVGYLLDRFLFEDVYE